MLGRWIEFAKASVGLAGEGAGALWRESVVSVITLQAVTFALATLDELVAEERALGVDRAEVLIREHVGQLDEIWRGEPMPGSLLELIGDARRGLEVAERVLVWEFGLVADEDVDSEEFYWEMPDCREELAGLAAGGFGGAVHLAGAGTLLVVGEPIGYVLLPSGVVVDEGCETLIAALGSRLGRVKMGSRMGARQIYREISAEGVILRDLVCGVVEDPIAGRPLVLPMLENGVVTGLTVPDRGVWRSQQEATWPRLGSGELGVLGVEFVDRGAE